MNQVMTASNSRHSIKKEFFGSTSNGELVDLYTLQNSQGNQIKITNYGATIVSIIVPDRNGQLDDVVLGYQSLSEYENNGGYLGATVGRFANRIDKGRFMLDGQYYQVSNNEGLNHLHGGLNALHNRVWLVDELENKGTVGLILQTQLEDGEEGFPGKLDITLTVTFNDSNELTFDYKAISNKSTIVNLTNHSYFNLSGSESLDCLEHILCIHASHYTPINHELIPTGEIKTVKNTHFDFTNPKMIGLNLTFSEDSTYPSDGYDHNWVLDHDSQLMQIAAEVVDPKTGRKLIVETTQPGLQFYSGQYLNLKTSKEQSYYAPFAGFCLETQHFPDSPNHDHFPSVRLDKGDVYFEKTLYRFELM